jgi:hypothetical protein
MFLLVNCLIVDIPDRIFLLKTAWKWIILSICKFMFVDFDKCCHLKVPIKACRWGLAKSYFVHIFLKNRNKLQQISSTVEIFADCRSEVALKLQLNRRMFTLAISCHRDVSRKNRSWNRYKNCNCKRAWQQPRCHADDARWKFIAKPSSLWKWFPQREPKMSKKNFLIIEKNEKKKG